MTTPTETPVTNTNDAVLFEDTSTESATAQVADSQVTPEVEIKEDTEDSTSLLGSDKKNEKKESLSLLGDDEEGDKKNSAKSEAPEKYEFKHPEGKEIDSSFLTAFETTARDLDLSQEKAQKLIDSIIPAADAAFNQKLQEDIKNFVTQCEDDLKADKELGGANLTKTMSTAKKGLEWIAKDNPEIKQVLRASNLDHHKSLVKLFYTIGKTVLPDDQYVKGQTATKPQSLGEILFGSS